MSLQAVLHNSKPLALPRGRQLPLYILPISNTLRDVDDQRALEILTQLKARGIGYTLAWNPSDREAALAEGLRIAALQRRLGMPVAVDATGCLHSFFDGEPSTLHIDDQGQPFADLSFDQGRKMGCPFALDQRIPVIRERVAFFVERYARAGATLDFVFADWEIDGPIEWNDAWASSRRCRRCRSHLADLADFRSFQRKMREIRSQLQREAFSVPVKTSFPRALVGNYAVYPHGGLRYWYDYFEKLPEGVPFVADQYAHYREWIHEFEPCAYTLAMPVVYTWYPIFHWYNFENTDYRWFYNMLRVASNAGQHTPRDTPIVTFVHHATTAPPPNPDPKVKPLSAAMYQELLWHLLLRGHDGFFLWCLADELGEETRLVHGVYAQALAYREFLDNGEPVTFVVPTAPNPVISGLRLGNRVLVRRTDFGTAPSPVELAVGDKKLEIPAGLDGCRVFTVP